MQIRRTGSKGGRSPRHKQGRDCPTWYLQAIDLGRHGRSAAVKKFHHQERVKRRGEQIKANAIHRADYPKIARAKPEHQRREINKIKRRERHEAIQASRAKRAAQTAVRLPIGG